MINFTGSCSCGSIKYTLRESPMFTQVCHCNLCKKITGSAFIINSMIEGWNFNLDTGVLKSYFGPTGSGRQHIIKRCNECGEAIVSYFGNTEHLAVIKVGSLSEPNLLPPQAHVFVNTKLDWLKLDDGLPQFQAFYDFKSLWPEKSYERLLKVRDKQREQRQAST